MPYIPNEARAEPTIDNPGKLNYVLTMKIKEYIDTHGESYAVYNEILGVLTAIQFELYRRKIASYEDKKIKLNGDVY